VPDPAERRFDIFQGDDDSAKLLRASEKIRTETAAHFEQVARAHQLRETTPDPKLVDMLIARVRQARKEERRTWGEGD